MTTLRPYRCVLIAVVCAALTAQAGAGQADRIAERARFRIAAVGGAFDAMLVAGIHASGDVRRFAWESEFVWNRPYARGSGALFWSPRPALDGARQFRNLYGLRAWVAANEYAEPDDAEAMPPRERDAWAFGVAGRLETVVIHNRNLELGLHAGVAVGGVFDRRDAGPSGQMFEDRQSDPFFSTEAGTTITVKRRIFLTVESQVGTRRRIIDPAIFARLGFRW